MNLFHIIVNKFRRQWVKPYLSVRATAPVGQYEDALKTQCALRETSGELHPYVVNVHVCMWI